MYLLNNEKTPVSFLSLGSLNTSWSFISNHPELSSGIKEILWSNDSLEPLVGFNYELDTESADKLIGSSLNLRVIGYYENTFFSNELIEALSGSDSPYSSLIMKPLRSGIDHDFFYMGYDEMIPLYLHFPGLFKTAESEDISFYFPGFNTPPSEEVLRISEGNTVEKHQVIKSLPLDTAFYDHDLQPFMQEIIEKHGREEFTVGVIANEMHRHLGVYAIVGVKMGMRAREYFHIGVDEMNVFSYCGSIPPLSCTNDGIQVSTGATAGHGLLEVTDKDFSPAARFTYMNRTIELTLKKEIADDIRKELQEINYVYGLDSNIYWELVRQKAILLWKNLDRHLMFDLKIINDPLLNDE
jgi:pyrimidine-specific ribonucleoside hydrolase